MPLKNHKVIWLNEEQGGRKSLPKGDIYYSILIANDNSAWSVVLSNREWINDYIEISDISPLVQDNWYKASPKLTLPFFLQEGKKSVAVVCKS